VAANNIKVDDNDLKAVAKEVARAQFAQYGMSNVPDEYLDNYAQDMLKKRENTEGLVDRAVDVKLTAALKQVVKLDEKNISLEDFQKMLNEK
jgi:trigger factor